MKKRLTALLCAALALVAACPVRAAGTAFPDVPEAHWAYDNICEAVELGVVVGYPDGSFSPETAVTCAEFSAFLARTFFACAGDGDPWYKPYIDALAESGVLDGTALAHDPGAADEPIRRYDMAQMMAGTLQAKGVELPAVGDGEGIADWSSVPETYREAVSACYSLGLLKGQPDGAFHGEDTMTRAEGCTVVIRMRNYLRVASETVQIGSLKGYELETGTRSTLLLTPSGEYTVTSDAPGVVSVEQASGCWVAVARAAGTATVTAVSRTGAVGTITLTVKAAETSEPDPSESEELSPDPLAANMEVRERMVALINEVRTANGLPELPTNQALMDAAQDISMQGFKSHNPYEWEAIAAYGWTNGGGVNLTVFTCGPNTDIAQVAVNNWTYSAGHLQTMLRDDVTCLGVGVTFANDRAYCYMIVGAPNAHGR